MKNRWFDSQAFLSLASLHLLSSVLYYPVQERIIYKKCKDNILRHGGKPYYFNRANIGIPVYLGSSVSQEIVSRLKREFDIMSEWNYKNLRMLAASGTILYCNGPKAGNQIFSRHL